MHIQNLFKVDFSTIENTEFNSKIEKLKKNVTIFSKNLDYKECELFDKYEVVFINDNPENLVFIGDSPRISPCSEQVENFIKQLYAILGPDDDGKTEIAAYEMDELNNESLPLCILIDWARENYAICLYIDNKESRLYIHEYKNLVK